LRYVTLSLARSPATFITLVALSAGCIVAQERDSSKDIPSIAREALKSVVTVETKDTLGKPLRQGSGFIVSSDGQVVLRGGRTVGCVNAQTLKTRRGRLSALIVDADIPLERGVHVCSLVVLIIFH